MTKSLRSERQKALCRLLVEARKEADLTQAEVADLLGRPQSFVAKAESGERRLDVIEFLELSAVVKVDPTKIIKSLLSVSN